MDASFDSAAAKYDETFTTSEIGKLQRSQVHHHLLNILKKKNIASILELNCGTGADAIWLVSQGYNVIATDISDKMIAVAKRKSNSEKLVFEKADINNLPEDYLQGEFDLVFSNFGGLNCLMPSELKLFFSHISRALKPKGQLVLVIMPKDTLWEQFYFTMKRDLKNKFRRKRSNAIANVDGEKIRTFYYNPLEAVTLASEYFTHTKLSPIGFFVPPSYLERFFKKKPRMLSFLGKLDRMVKNSSGFAKYADHYLIAFEKK